MTSILLAPFTPKFSYYLPSDNVNTAFLCVYKNQTANRYNMTDIEIDGFEWRILIDLKPSRDLAELQIFRTGVDENDTNISAEVFVKILSPSGEQMTFEGSSLSAKKFEFPMTEEGLQKVDVSLYTFDFIVQIKTPQIQKEPIYGCSVTKMYSSDMILQIEGKKVYVSVEWLSKHSKYFEQIWKRMSEFEKDVETALPVLTLHEVVYQDFMRLIEMVADFEETVTVRNVEAPIELADYLMFENVFERLKQFLIEDDFNYFSLCYKLLISQAYYMPQLQEKCLEKLGRSAPSDVRNDIFFQELNSDMVTEIVARRQKRMAEEKKIKEISRTENFAGGPVRCSCCGR